MEEYVPLCPIEFYQGCGDKNTNWNWIISVMYENEDNILHNDPTNPWLLSCPMKCIHPPCVRLMRLILGPFPPFCTLHTSAKP